MSVPIISIVMPCHNCSAYVAEAVQSVLSQTVVDWELIVVDDFSSDDSASIIAKFSNSDSRITLLRLSRNSGAAVARNRGIENSKGRYLTFLDADDFWDSDFLYNSMRLSKASPFVYSGYRRVSASGMVINIIKPPEMIKYHELIKGTPISCLTAFIDTNFFGKNIFFPGDTLREDFALWLFLLKKVDFAYGGSFVSANYRVHSMSSSANKLKMALHTWLLYRRIEKINFFRACFYFINYAANGFSKKFLNKF